MYVYDCTMTQVTTSRSERPARRHPRTPKAAAARRAPIDGLLNVDLFRALGDPTRVRLLACLAKCARACAVGEIAACCSVDLSVVSRHLAVLERAGALESSKHGRVVSYRVRYGEVAQRLRSLAEALERCCPDDDACCGNACACGPATCTTGGTRG